MVIRRLFLLTLLLAFCMSGVACSPDSQRTGNLPAPALKSQPEDQATLLHRAMLEMAPEELPDDFILNCNRLQKMLVTAEFPQELRPKCVTAALLKAEQSAVQANSYGSDKSSDKWLEEAQSWGATEEMIADARENAKAKERQAAVEAQQAAAEARQRENQARKELREGGANPRREMANKMRTTFLDNGLDIKVKVSGRYAERITLEYVLFSDVWSHRFQKDGIIGQLSAAGFERVDMTNGYNWHVYWRF